jgi:hypothetical protein
VVVTADADAVKFAEEAPEPMLSGEGTVKCPVAERVTLAPPVPAAADSPTVQVDVPGPTTLAGEQDRLLTMGGGTIGVVMVTVPLEGVGVTAVPVASDSMGLVTAITVEVFVVVGEIPRLTTPTVPLAIVLLFVP